MTRDPGGRGWTSSYPSRSARTRRFTLGQPRSVTVADDGSHVLFLRSPGPEDPRTCLWVLDTGSGEELLVADPAELPHAPSPSSTPDGACDGSADEGALEASRRERLRESAEGITAYACDRSARTVVFVVGSGLFLADLTDLSPLGPAASENSAAVPVRALSAPRGAFDPRPDPSGAPRVAFVADGSLHLLDMSGGGVGDQRVLASPGPDGGGGRVSWGLAEFVAEEEMQRFRGFWWAPDGSCILAARVDNGPVATWYLADPADPSRSPRPVRYPAAGAANASVGLAFLGTARDSPDTVSDTAPDTVPDTAPDVVPVVGWDTDAYPYLVSVSWTSDGPPLAAVQSRDQRSVLVLALDPATGQARALTEMRDERWVEIVPGVPRWAGGDVLHVVDVGGARRLVRRGRDLTGDGIQVRAVVDVGPSDALVLASREDPTCVEVLSVAWDGTVAAVSRGPGVHGAARGGGVTVVWTSGPTDELVSTLVRRPGATPVPIRTHAAVSGAVPRVTAIEAGASRIRTHLLLPTWHRRGPLPVLLCPYAGPHAQLVLSSAASLRTPQWYAERGYAVVVADGRGTPGRSPEWEKAVHRDLAGPVLDDQVAALDAAAEVAASAGLADLDLSRVGIRGWSFGGYLAALAVLRRPDRFHAAVAGAPVTDWSLYDTHYTERYLGLPDADADAYERCSLLPDAALPVDEEHPARPLMIIHGMVDDNVVVAHSLRLSAALLAGGRPHTVLPLTGVTHFTPQVTVAENLMLLEARFLDAALLPPGPDPAARDPSVPDPA